MKNYFNYIDYEEIRQRAYEYIFSFCDTAEYLYERSWENRCLEHDLIGHKYENILSYIIKKEDTKSWGMQGTVYTFSLSEPVKNMIIDNGLGGMISISCENSLNRNIENLTLYKGAEEIYSVCSHEGYTEISEGFREKISAFCYEAMQNTKLFLILREKQRKLLKNAEEWTNEKIRIALEKLYELPNQVAKACDFYIYVTPKHEITFEEYKALAKIFLTESVNQVINKAKDFADLYPKDLLCPTKGNFKGKISFYTVQAKLCSDLFWQISVWQDFLL